MSILTEQQTEDMQQIKTSHDLLEARKEALQQVVHGSIRPHGKLWGMDVFSWTNPDVEAIASTIHSFPFPIVWLAPPGLLMSVVQHDPSVTGNIHTVISYGNTQTDLNKDKFQGVSAVFTTNDVQEAFKQMNVSRLKRGVILFCSAGTDHVMYENAFGEYLDVHQV